MKVTLSWLREFAPDIDGDPGELGEILSGLGLAVEDMQVVGEIVEGGVGEGVPLEVQRIPVREPPRALSEQLV